MMTKLKVIHILHSVGGVDVSLRLILENINPQRFENIVIHGNTDTDEKFRDTRGEVITSFQTSIVRNISPLKDLKALIYIIRILKKEKPDLIHCHSAKGGILGKLASVIMGIPCYHTPQAYSYLSAKNKLKRNIFLGIEKILSRFDNKILASSNSEKNRALNEVGYDENKVDVFSNSINPITRIYDLSIEKIWPENYICSVGRPSYQKNIELMISVLHRLRNKKPNVHLVLMGVGFHSPNLDKVEELIKHYKLENNITLLKWMRREDIFNIIANSQLYVSTARYEGLPYSVIESLALGKACVVSDADGNRDLVEDGKNGFVIDSSDPEEFSNKINELLDDKYLLSDFEKYSKIKFEKEFNIDKSIYNLEKIYSDQVRFN